MKLAIKDIKGNDQGELEVRFPVIEDGRGTQAVHDAVVAYMAAQRSGTACAKTKGEVVGSGKKPWRQKGTGRARAGMVRSPLWRKGGVVFGPRPRDFGKKVNKTTRQLALRKALSERIKAGEVMIVDDFKLETHKTKDLLGVLAALKVEGTALVVSAEINRNLLLASRNIQDVDATTSDTLNTYQVLRFDRIVFTRSAFEKVEQRLA